MAGELSRCLNAGGMGRQDYETETLIPVIGGFFSLPVSFRTAGDGAVYLEGDKTSPLTTGTDPSANINAFNLAQITSNVNRNRAEPGLPQPPLCKAGQPHVAYAIKHDQEPKVGTEICPTMQAAEGGSGCTSVAADVTIGGLFPRTQYAVRRLTPRECERLQGFPDDYTLVQFRGKPAADGPRYRALGNSMAVPCMAWIGRRIAAVALQPSTGKEAR